jgi:hypothetical protein
MGYYDSGENPFNTHLEQKGRSPYNSFFAPYILISIKTNE